MQISRWQLSTIVLGAALAGSFFNQGRLASKVDAAPADVKGSGNIPVDTYTNDNGDFLLFSDGRLLDAKNPSADLGHPYDDPIAGTFGAISAVPAMAKGSPHIAVKVLRKSSATYVLFADGRLKLPASATARAGNSQNRTIVIGRVHNDGSSYCEGGTLLTYNSNGASFTYKKPFAAKPIILVTPIEGSGFFEARTTLTGGTITVSWGTSSVGKGFSFSAIGD